MIRISFLSFCFAVIRISAAGVLPPPLNVTLDCRNFTNILHWKYDRASDDLKFMVNVLSISSLTGPPRWVNSSLQIDLSYLDDPDGEYLLTVRAVEGQNMSEDVPPEGLSFSYLKSSLVDQKCFLDFPPVNVSALPDDNLEFSFRHPSLLYRQMPSTKNGKKKNNAVFNYVVLINQKEHHHSFRCASNVCKQMVPVDGAQEKHCLKVSGELDNIAVLGTQVYCAPAFHKTDFTPFYVVLALLLFLALGIVLFMVYRKQTQAHSPIPSSMRISRGLKQYIMGEQKENLTVPEVVPTSPTCLLSDTDVSDLTPEASEPVLRRPIGVGVQQESEPCDQEERPAEDADYMPGNRLDEDDGGEKDSAYEKRPVLVQVGPKDTAEGYRD